jgi:hypothetical protein
MSEKSASGFVTSLLALLFLVLVGIAIVAYSMGWLSIDRQPEQTTIQIDTRKVEQAATEARQEGEALVEKAGEALQQSGEALEDSVEPTDRNEQ